MLQKERRKFKKNKVVLIKKKKRNYKKKPTIAINFRNWTNNKVYYQVYKWHFIPSLKTLTKYEMKKEEEEEKN